MQTLVQVAPQILETDAVSVSECILHMIANYAQQIRPRNLPKSVHQTTSTTDIKYAIDKHITNPELTVAWLKK